MVNVQFGGESKEKEGQQAFIAAAAAAGGWYGHGSESSGRSSRGVAAEL